MYHKIFKWFFITYEIHVLKTPNLVHLESVKFRFKQSLISFNIYDQALKLF